jgi:hypothetical protein
MLVFEDETIVTQKPCIRKSMSFEGEQQQKLDIMAVEREILHVHIHAMA